MTETNTVLSDEEIEAFRKQQENFVASAQIKVMPRAFSKITQNTSESSSKKLIIILLGVIFVVVAIFLAYFYFSMLPDKNKPLVVSPITKEPAADLSATSSQQVIADVPVVATSTVVAATTTVISTATTTISTSSDENVFEADGDSDKDGLNDSVELLIGSDAKNADTDGDAYSDYSELANLYDPISKGRLTDNINISKYQDAVYKYSIVYPLIWKASPSDDGSVIFKIPNGQFIQVIVEENDKKMTLDNWYKEQVSESKIAKEQRIVSKTKSWTGIKSSDGLTIYLLDAKKKNFYVITYNIVENEKPIYQKILDAMLASLELK